MSCWQVLHQTLWGEWRIEDVALAEIFIKRLKLAKLLLIPFRDLGTIICHPNSPSPPHLKYLPVYKLKHSQDFARHWEYEYIFKHCSIKVPWRLKHTMAVKQEQIREDMWGSERTIEDISFLQGSSVWDAMADDFVNRCAAGFGKIVVVERGGVAVPC